MYQTALHAAAANGKPEAWMVNAEPKKTLKGFVLSFICHTYTYTQYV